MISNILRPHIHNILTYPRYSIAIDFFFKHNFKFRIISVYLPSDDLQLSLDIQNNVIQWINQSLNNNIQPIIMRDLNAFQNNILSAIKYKLL